MNLALPALVLLYLALPGFLIVKASRGRLAQGVNEPVVNLSAMTVGFVVALILAPALHLLWIFLVETFTPYRIDLSTVGYLLAGDYGEGDRFETAMAVTTRHPVAVLGYFGSLCLFAVLLGRWFHTKVIEHKLDQKVSWLRFNNDWHYLLTDPPESEGFNHATRVAVTVRQGDGVYVYTGFLETYSLTTDAKLDRIVLMEPVYRRPLTKDPAEGETLADRDTSGRFYKIPGDRFVVWAKDITTLNVDYLYLIPEDVPDVENGPDDGDPAAGPPAAPAPDDHAGHLGGRRHDDHPDGGGTPPGKA